MLSPETHFLLAVVVNGMFSIVVAGGVNIVVIAVFSEM